MFNLKFKKNKKEEFDPINGLLMTQGEIIEIVKSQNEAIKSLQKSVIALQELVIKNEFEAK